MGSIVNGVLSSGLGTTLPSENSPAKIREAASQFESLLVGQILKSVHDEDGGGWLGTGEDKNASSAMGLADEFLAQSISKRGGLGLAKMISHQLERASSSSPATPQPPDSVGRPHTDR